MWLGLSPIDKFSDTVNDHTHSLSVHAWGCPAYMLDPTLQAGRKIPKWSPQKGQGQFLGWSQSHVLLVALVHNLHTGSITLQCHIVINTWFTIIAREGANEDFVSL
eukprot:2436907-Ditylum_brightwellii.AAC.1